MADAIAALGLAANIVQFIGYGSKITRLLWSSYRAVYDGIEELPTPELATKDLQRILECLQRWTASGNETAEMDSNLQDLVDRCHQTARHMLELLSKIKMPTKPSVPNRREFIADSVVRAWLAVWKEGDIRKLQKQLDEFRQQLTIHLLVILRYEPWDVC